MTAKTNLCTPLYQNPPVDEVTCGCQFQPLERLKVPHMGLLWDRFRKEFPTADHAPPIVSEAGMPVIDRTGLPWPRVWFINQTESRLIQFQPDRLHFNWRRREGEPTYPHYPEMIDRFMESFAVLEKFVAELGLGVIQPVVYEMTYINHMAQGAGWETIDDLPKVFRDFSWTKDENRYLPRPANVSWQAAFELPDGGGRFSAKLNQAKRSADSPMFLLLELTARGIGQDKTPGAARN